MGFFGAQGAPGLFCYLFYLLLNFIFSLRRGRFLFFDPLYAFLNFIFIPSTRSGRAGPLLSGQQKVGKDRRKGVSPPCESPDQSGVLDAPLWKPPSLAALSGLAELLAASRLELRCRWGKPRARARSPPLPHLHRFVWGLRPLAPCVPQRGKSACHARLGASPPCPLRSPKGKVCRSCAPAHGTASETAFAATPSQVSRKLLPRSG